MGVVEKSAGRVLPGASKLAKAAAVPARTAAAELIAELPWVRVLLSDGKQYEVHPDDVQELQRRDPQAKILR